VPVAVLALLEDPPAKAGKAAAITSTITAKKIIVFFKTNSYLVRPHGRTF
jgi:hypothetical protein